MLNQIVKAGITVIMPLIRTRLSIECYAFCRSCSTILDFIVIFKPYFYLPILISSFCSKMIFKTNICFATSFLQLLMVYFKTCMGSGVKDKFM